MSNFAEAKKELINYMYARTPLVIIHSDERERVERMLNEISNESQISILYVIIRMQNKLDALAQRGIA